MNFKKIKYTKPSINIKKIEIILYKKNLFDYEGILLAGCSRCSPTVGRYCDNIAGSYDCIP